LSGSTDLSLRFVSHTLDLINKVRVDFGENVPHFWELVAGISSPDDFAHIRLIWEIVFYWISVIADQTANSELIFNHGLPVVIRFESAVGFPLGRQSQIRLSHVFFVVMRRVYYSEAVQDVVVSQILSKFSYQCSLVTHCVTVYQTQQVAKQH